MVEGRILVQRMPDGIIESRGEGVITPALVQYCADRIRALRGAGTGLDLLLFDALAVDTWLPGSAIIAIRAGRIDARRTLAAAYVTRTPALLGLGAAAFRLVPEAPRAMFGTRTEALGYLHSARSTRLSCR